MECKICHEKIRECNLKKHEIVCEKNDFRVQRNIGKCKECGQEFKRIDNHIRNGCKGKIKLEREEKECTNCGRKINVNNYKRHYERCILGHKINRRKWRNS
jgi:hypothetical protein